MTTYKDEWKTAIAGHAELRQLHETMRSEVRTRWNRSLPFADEVFDRWERAAALGFGAETSIYDACLVLGDVTVGEQTWVGPYTILDGSGGRLTIGSHCTISAGVHLYTHDTAARSLTRGRAPVGRSPVTIHDATFIGPHAVVLRGVTIGTQCVIGAGALVNRNVPDRSILFGVPGRVVGRVEVDGDRVDYIYE
jgi:acetyltransferase-like isoleucine patch superfamily enzyme